MSELRIQLEVYPGRQEVHCLLCGKAHERQYVSVTLWDGDRRLGDVGPCCLGLGPGESAGRVRRQAERLAALAEWVAGLGQWPVPLADLLDAERHEVRTRFPGLREEDLRRLVDDRYRELLAEGDAPAGG